jgi:NACHT conflict system protein/NACHT domain-containing protein
MGVVTLTGIETALVNVGRAVVTPFVTRWLGGRRQARERSLPLSDLLQQKAADEFTRRRGERQIEAVVDDVAERLAPLITTRFAALPEHEAVASLDAVADTFRRADLSDEALFAADVDPARFAAHLRASAPPVALSELGQRLYDLALDDCSRCFTQFVVRTAPFAGRASVEMLARLSDLTELMSETLRRLAVAGLSPVEFLPRYAEVLTTKLNVLELVGVETQFRPRTTLNVAYISLAVSGDGAATRARPPQWDPGMLRHARPDGNGAERVEQALAKRTRTLIRGDAGAGKSTLLRWLAVTAAGHGFTGELAGWNGRVPFLIKLRSWPEALPAPERFLTGVADPVAGTMPAGWVHRQLAEGRALLLVDGVDELPAERRPRVRTWLKDLLDAYPDSLVVVTSRPPAAPVRWLAAEGFESLTLERLAPADVRALIDQWHRAARTAASLPCPAHELPRYEQSLLTQLAANRHLYRLAGNPLMAAMLCALNLDRETHLPPDRMGIYQAAVDMLLQRRDTERGVPSTLPQMTTRERLQLLQDLAWRISLNGRSELSHAETLDYLQRRLAGMPRVTAAPSAVLTHLIERSGILREPAAGRIDFVHRTFQEYLAAREAAEQNMAGMLANQVAHLDTWREIIIMAAGHGNSPMRTELINAILRRAEREPNHRRALVLLAASCLETMPSLEPPALLTEIDTALDTLLPPRNRNEARSLYAVGEALLDRLPRDGSHLTGAQAAAIVRTAALINGPRAMKLLARYAADPRVEVQRELVRAWTYFDPAEYGREVLAEARLDNGRAHLREPALLDGVRHLRHLELIEAIFETAVDLAELTPNPQLRRLELVSGWVGPLGELARFPELQVLTLMRERRIEDHDIRQLAELPSLTEIYMYSKCGISQAAVDALAKLRKLTEIGLELTDAVNLSPLIRMPRLTRLALNGPHLADFGRSPAKSVRYLSLGQKPDAPSTDPLPLVKVFARLTELQLYGFGWPDDLGLVADLPMLESLFLHHRSATLLHTLSAAPRLRRISLGLTDSVDLSPLIRLAGLERIDIQAVRRPVDVSPFRAWSGGPLTISALSSQKIIGQGALPSSVRVRRFDPNPYNPDPYY